MGWRATTTKDEDDGCLRARADDSGNFPGPSFFVGIIDRPQQTESVQGNRLHMVALNILREFLTTPSQNAQNCTLQIIFQILNASRRIFIHNTPKMPEIKWDIIH